MQNTPVPEERPPGVKITSVLMGIQAVLLVILGISTVIIIFKTGLLNLDILALAFGMLALVLAFSFWHLQRWTYWTTIGLEALIVIMALIKLVQIGTNRSSNITIMIIGLIIIAYLLTDPDIKAAFHIKENHE